MVLFRLAHVFWSFLSDKNSQNEFVDCYCMESTQMKPSVDPKAFSLMVTRFLIGHLKYGIIEIDSIF